MRQVVSGVLIPFLWMSCACPPVSSEAPDGASADAGSDAGADPCQAWALIRCQRVGECAPSILTGTWGGEGACLEALETACRLRRDALGSGATARSIAECTSKWVDAECVEVLEPELDPCTLGNGTQDAGTPCYYGEQCASGICSAKLEQQHGCGACNPTVQDGAPCLLDPDDGMTCGFGLTCLNLKCVRQSAVSKLNGSCDPSLMQRCANSLFCDGTVCRAQKSLGSPCAEMFGECSLAEGLFCDPATDRCATIPVSSVGQHCHVLGTDGGSICGGGAYCEASLGLLCVAKKARNEACGGDAGTAFCLDESLVCLEGICQDATRLSCAGGPIDAGAAPANNEFIFDVPYAQVTLECASGGGTLSVSANARYGNNSSSVITVSVDSTQVLLDGGPPYPVQVMPGTTGAIPANSSIAVLHSGSVGLAPAPCQRCGESVGVAMSVSASSGKMNSFVTQAILDCPAGDGGSSPDGGP